MDKDNTQKTFENGANPMLQFDAFTAGVKNGGLRSVTSINMLVCYIVATVGNKVTAQNIIDTVDEGMIANHFETADAISRLKKNGVIKENEDSTLELIDKSTNAIELIERDLPLTVREKSIMLCQQIIAREVYQRENKAEIIENGNGYTVKLKISDKDTDFLSLELFAATQEQAELIKSKFVANPIGVYNTLIDSIFENLA